MTPYIVFEISASPRKIKNGIERAEQEGEISGTLSHFPLRGRQVLELGDAELGWLTI